MTGRGSISKAPKQRLRLMLAALLFWFLLVCVLGGWWGSLVLKYAHRVGELEKLAGFSPEAVALNWAKTERMLYWEGAVFFLLLLASSVCLFWLYWRDAKRSRALQSFFASLTHELRTPLTSIRLQAEAIAEDQKSHALTRRLLEDTIRLESQVERTLELARLEGGGPLFTQPTRLKPLVERILSSLADAYPGRLEISSQIENAIVRADTTAVQVILKNLLENAVRHSKKNLVQVRLSTERTLSGELLFRYEDDGEGYAGDPRLLGKLFHKGASSQGAGVGLYLAKVLMERMGGKAVFSGSPSFRVELRFAMAEEGHRRG